MQNFNWTSKNLHSVPNFYCYVVVSHFCGTKWIFTVPYDFYRNEFSVYEMVDEHWQHMQVLIRHALPIICCNGSMNSFGSSKLALFYFVKGDSLVEEDSHVSNVTNTSALIINTNILSLNNLAMKKWLEIFNVMDDETITEI